MTKNILILKQHKVAGYIEAFSKEVFIDKPAHLTNYEYDVLYPEAVIWALRKKEGLTYRKAEMKYEEGFKMTTEEMIKQRCHEILNRL